MLYNSILWQHFSQRVGKNPWDANQDSLRMKLLSNKLEIIYHCDVPSFWECGCAVGRREGSETLVYGQRNKAWGLRHLGCVPLCCPPSGSRGNRLFDRYLIPLCSQRWWQRRSGRPSVLYSRTPIFRNMLRSGAMHCFGLGENKASWLHLLPAQSFPDATESRRGSHAAWGPSFVRLVNSSSRGFYFLLKATEQWISCVFLGTSPNPPWVSDSHLWKEVVL